MRNPHLGGPGKGVPFRAVCPLLPPPPPPPPPLLSRTNWTRHVPHPVLTGHVSSRAGISHAQARLRTSPAQVLGSQAFRIQCAPGRSPLPEAELAGRAGRGCCTCARVVAGRAGALISCLVRSTRFPPGKSKTWWFTYTDDDTRCPAPAPALEGEACETEGEASEKEREAPKGE